MGMALKKLAGIRLENVENLNNATLKAESYYEIVKELITAVLAIKGYKSYSHERLIAFVEEYYSTNFTKAEIQVIDQLRIIRNDIVYRGAFVEEDYPERNGKRILGIIHKLRALVGEET